MEALFEEIGSATSIPFTVLTARILLATLLGAVIGFEREWQRHSAGLRTHIMVCVAAAVYGILTVEITLAPIFANAPVQVDPVRAVEAVTAGVAFLAAGLIWAGRGKVHGLTTGAGMWLAGAIGLACGLGLWQIALLGTGLAVLVLALVRFLSDWISGGTIEDDETEPSTVKQAYPPTDPSKPKN